MLRLAFLLSVLPLAAGAQVLDTPFEQPAPLNMEDGSPFPLGPDGRPMRPVPRGEGQVLPGLDALPSTRPMPRGDQVATPDAATDAPAGDTIVEEQAGTGEDPLFPFSDFRPGFDDTPREVREDQNVASSPGALLRGLDKVSGAVTDLDLSVGETVQLGRLAVTLEDCRYPVNDPAGDAYALLLIEAEGMSGPAFEGWMIASSPALSALDHPRYDVWVMRCRSS